MTPTPGPRPRPGTDLLFSRVMRIQCTNPQTKRLKLPFMSEPVEFASTGTARVESSVGERLVDELDAIEPYEES